MALHQRYRLHSVLYFETPTLPPSHFMLHKAAAGKAYEFASSVKEKLDETAESQASS